MPYDPERHHRRSSRLKGYDYAQAGAYFLTLVTQNRACLFGRVVDGCMELSDAGEVADSCWLAIPEHFPFVELDAYIIMPNHVHGIIVIAPDGDGAEALGVNVGMVDERAQDVGAKDVGAKDVGAKDVGAKDLSPLLLPTPFRSPLRTVGSVVRGFKTGVTTWFRANTDVVAVWQRNYYDHIIRNERALDSLRHYIAANPSCWPQDGENPYAPPWDAAAMARVAR